MDGKVGQDRGNAESLLGRIAVIKNELGCGSFGGMYLSTLGICLAYLDVPFSLPKERVIFAWFFDCRSRLCVVSVRANEIFLVKDQS